MEVAIRCLAPGQFAVYFPSRSGLIGGFYMTGQQMLDCISDASAITELVAFIADSIAGDARDFRFPPKSLDPCFASW